MDKNLEWALHISSNIEYSNNCSTFTISHILLCSSPSSWEKPPPLQFDPDPYPYRHAYIHVKNENLATALKSHDSSPCMIAFSHIRFLEDSWLCRLRSSEPSRHSWGWHDHLLTRFYHLLTVPYRFVKKPILWVLRITHIVATHTSIRQCHGNSGH